MEGVKDNNVTFQMCRLIESHNITENAMIEKVTNDGRDRIS